MLKEKPQTLSGSARMALERSRGMVRCFSLEANPWVHFVERLRFCRVLGRRESSVLLVTHRVRQLRPVEIRQASKRLLHALLRLSEFLNSLLHHLWLRAAKSRFDARVLRSNRILLSAVAVRVVHALRVK